MKYALCCLMFSFGVLITGCQSKDERVFQGYIEADYLHLSCSQGGKLKTVIVKRGQVAQRNMLAFTLETEHERQKIEEIYANIRQAQAELKDYLVGQRSEEISVIQAQLNEVEVQQKLAQLTYDRYQTVYRKGGISQALLDQSKADLEAIMARHQQLTAQLKVAELPARPHQILAKEEHLSSLNQKAAQAKWLMEQKLVKIPQTSVVAEVLYQEGEWVTPGSTVLRLFVKDKVKVRFFVPNTVHAQLRLDQRIRISGIDDIVQARISYISDTAEFTPPMLFSQKQSHKMVYLVEALFEKHDVIFTPGQSVMVKL